MRILALSGGGIRGYIPALVMAEIESRTGKPSHDLFDLIIGTSTGGILGAGLALGLPAERMAAFYRDHGPAIFRQTLSKRVRSLCGLADEAYDADGLESALADVFGNAPLSDAKTRLCLTAYDIETRSPVFFKSWLAAAESREDHLVTAVTRATAAAPTYFEPTLVKGSTGLMRACVDGGVFANNPAVCGLVEALKLGVSPDDIRLLSCGTGTDGRPYFLSEARKWGLAGWARPLLDILFSGQSEVAEYQCARILGPDRFVRLNPDLLDPLGMDDASAKALKSMEFYADRLTRGGDMTLAMRLLEAA